jgi:hypothetical protein
MAGDSRTRRGDKALTRRALGAAVLLLAGALAIAQSSAPLGARLKLRWGRSTVTFVEAGSAHEISIREQFDAARLEKVTLQSAKKANGFIYLLLDVTGPSKYPPDSHQCGAGTESNLIWLKVDTDWKPVVSRNFRYDSCWSTISASDAPAWKGDTLTVSADYVKSGGIVETKVASYSIRTMG